MSLNTIDDPVTWRSVEIIAKEKYVNVESVEWVKL